MKNKRKYYAEHCLYGVNTSYDSMGRNFIVCGNVVIRDCDAL